MIALDGVLDRGYTLAGGQPARYRTPTLSAEVDWRNPSAFTNSGAPPNGSDYLRFRRRSGSFLTAAEIKSIAFDGSRRLPGPPRRVDGRPRTRPTTGGNAALHSGSGGGLDRGIVREVKVPGADAASSRFQTRYDLAPGLDFAFVQVSTNGGRTWRSVGGPLTTATADPERLASSSAATCPALPGSSGRGQFPAWTSASFDLAAYRGKTVLLAFRYVSDSRVAFPGWWIDDIRLGGTTLSGGRSLAGWKSFSRVSPGERRRRVHASSSSATRPRRSGRASTGCTSTAGCAAGSRAHRYAFLSGGYDVVAAIVTYDEPTEAKPAYADYVLRVNGILQPGG